MSPACVDLPTEIEAVTNSSGGRNTLNVKRLMNIVKKKPESLKFCFFSERVTKVPLFFGKEGVVEVLKFKFWRVEKKEKKE